MAAYHKHHQFSAAFDQYFVQSYQKKHKKEWYLSMVLNKEEGDLIDILMP